MASEKVFENKIKEFLKTLPNTWYFKYWAGPMSQAGIPDVIACVNGHFVAIEVKAPNGVVSALQERNIRLINKCNGNAYITYPKDFEGLKMELTELARGD